MTVITPETRQKVLDFHLKSLRDGLETIYHQHVTLSDIFQLRDLVLEETARALDEGKSPLSFPVRMFASDLYLLNKHTLPNGEYH